MLYLSARDISELASAQNALKARHISRHSVVANDPVDTLCVNRLILCNAASCPRAKVYRDEVDEPA